MSWVNALALAGAAFVALPVLIHMMGRAPARTERFPSLRFIAPARLLPSRRTKIQDPLLLALRALALLLAALALAGPVFDAVPSASPGSLRSVAIVIDTSTSVLRGGGLAAAKAIVDSLAADATASAVVRTAHPGAAIAGAAAWLAQQTGTREIVVISDFQLGAIDSADFASVPSGTQVTTRRLPFQSAAVETRTEQGGAAVTARLSRRGDSVNVTWSGVASRASQPFEVLAGPSESAAIVLARRSASTIGRSASSVSTPLVSVVYPNASERANLIKASGKLSKREHGGILARLAADPLISGLVEVAQLNPASDRGGERLLLFPSSELSSEASVALQAALARAIAGSGSAQESETQVLSDAELSAVAVPRGAAIAAASETLPTESVATRWLWLAALALLTLEWLVRRNARVTTEATSVA